MNIVKLVLKIKNLCEMQNIKTGKLLKEADLSSHVIDDWQSGKYEPSFSALFRICEVLNTELKELFSEEELCLTESQAVILNEWKNLSESEKSALYDYIAAFKCRKKITD